MKHRPTIIMALIVMFLLPLHPAHAGFMDIFKGLGETVTSDPSPLSEETIIKGLKEALEKGTQSAVAMVSKPDGYYLNPEIKIPLPQSVRKVETILRSVGFGSTVDQFEQSMNRAAERAAPQALSLFVDTIKQISFDDARKILNGRDNEATLYFKKRTEQKLTGLFKPVVHDAMAEVDTTRLFQDLSAKTASIPLAGTLTQDPDAYVTARALDGLFLMLEKEELKIRQDPAARVTDLLKTVFKSKQ
ncbi:MAG: DUF4197 domain-containing protein [Desulfobacterium sp.]|nr:DUF4197 domain-containing protein [Desulfobacterium sp.]